MSNLDTMPIEDLCISTIRTLSMDAVQQANSGHPGTPMALAPLAYVLWKKVLRYNPQNPHWFDRDRFVLSNGHASMLQYAMLYLTGYDLSLDEIQNFRQWGSKTPGHPEYGMTPGVEVTTGPLGQGVMNSVGMAMAEAHLAAVFNRPDHAIVDHYTYAVCGDGDLMEGASHEAASLAGHLGLGKLIWVYDDNHISIEGDTALAYSDDVAQRFTGYQWQVQDIGDRGNDLAALSQALEAARAETERPSLILVRTHIGYGSPNYQDTPDAHGAPLGEAEIQRTKAVYGLLKGAYILSPEQGSEPQAVLIASGSEVPLILEAQAQLATDGVDARVVSMPSWDLFREQSDAYQQSVFPPSVTARLAVEAGSPMGWHEWVGSAGDILGITTFGASAPASELFQQYGFTVDNIVARTKNLI